MTVANKRTGSGIMRSPSFSGRGISGGTLQQYPPEIASELLGFGRTATSGSAATKRPRHCRGLSKQLSPPSVPLDQRCAELVAEADDDGLDIAGFGVER